MKLLAYPIRLLRRALTGPSLSERITRMESEKADISLIKRADSLSGRVRISLEKASRDLREVHVTSISELDTLREVAKELYGIHEQLIVQRRRALVGEPHQLPELLDKAAGAIRSYENFCTHRGRRSS